MPTPGTLPSTPDALSSPTHLDQMFGGTLKHSDGINQMLADILQAWMKLGVTDAPAHDAPVANRALVSLANGKSGWSQVISAMIVDGTITTLDLAANAATQALTANPSTSSPSINSAAGTVALPEMSIPIVAFGGPILVIYAGSFFGSSVGAQFQLTPFEFGVGPIAPMSQFTIQSTSQYFVVAGHVLWTPNPARLTTTIDLRWTISAGSITNNSVSRSLSAIDIKR